VSRFFYIMFFLVLQRLIIQLVLDVLYFSVWWYSVGVMRFGVGLGHIFQDVNVYLAPLLWLRNMFVPMFGQTDIQGRLMSIFIRFFNTIFRLIVLLFLAVILLVVFVAWLIFPIFVAYMLSLSVVVV